MAKSPSLRRVLFFMTIQIRLETATTTRTERMSGMNISISEKYDDIPDLFAYNILLARPDSHGEKMTAFG